MLFDVGLLLLSAAAQAAREHPGMFNAAIKSTQEGIRTVMSEISNGHEKNGWTKER